jgi:NAD+ synthase (glutamine-hydrolysing)
MVLTGYPVRTLHCAQSSSRRPASPSTGCRRLRGRLRGSGRGIIWTGWTFPPPEGGNPQNAAASCTRAGHHLLRQHHLPNYGFDEYRYFGLATNSGAADPRRRRRGGDLRGPLAGRRPGRRTREAEAGPLAVINASPYERDKDDTRGELVPRAVEAGCPLAYVNLVGGQDELVRFGTP